MKRLFISQPMRDRSTTEIMQERFRAAQEAEELLGESVEVIASFMLNGPAHKTPLWYLGKSLEMMADADIVFFVPGWEEARGCRIEHEAAIQYGISRIEKRGSVTLLKDFA